MVTYFVSYATWTSRGEYSFGNAIVERPRPISSKGDTAPGFEIEAVKSQIKKEHHEREQVIITILSFQEI